MHGPRSDTASEPDELNADEIKMVVEAAGIDVSPKQRKRRRKLGLAAPSLADFFRKTD